MYRQFALRLVAGLLAVAALGVQPAVAEDSVGDSQGVFGHELVDKVKKGAIFIWAMTPGGPVGSLSSAWIGSGFIFQAVPEENAAYALTNHHVANDTAVLQIETWDRRTFKADLIATEPGIDVALIKIYNIPGDAYEVNVLGDSEKVQIGEPALAIGAPGSRDSLNANRSDPSIDFGLHLTTTMRVVTGIQTEPFEYITAWTSWRNQLGRQVITNLPSRFVVQSTINGGNSGGPLYNARGEVIGLNHAHFGAGSIITQNENYTIPINYAKNFAYQILNNGSYEIPWMGIDAIFPPYFTTDQQVVEFIERWYKQDVLRVYSIRNDSPAQRAGLQRDDIILEFDGKTFATVADFRRYVFDLPIGYQTTVLIKRGREKITKQIEIGPKRRYDSEFSI